jgi:hypothetical protein
MNRHEHTPPEPHSDGTFFFPQQFGEEQSTGITGIAKSKFLKRILLCALLSSLGENTLEQETSWQRKYQWRTQCPDGSWKTTDLTIGVPPKMISLSLYIYMDISPILNKTVLKNG